MSPKRKAAPVAAEEAEDTQIPAATSPTKAPPSPSKRGKPAARKPAAKAPAALSSTPMGPPPAQASPVISTPAGSSGYEASDTPADTPAVGKNKPKAAAKSKAKAISTPKPATSTKTPAIKAESATPAPTLPPLPSTMPAEITGPSPRKFKPKAIINSAPTDELSLYFFGTNEDGQLGLGSARLPGSKVPGAIPPSKVPGSPAKSPTFNPDLSNLGVVQVALGEAHGIALTSDNRVLTWGRADFGCLGREIGADIYADEEAEDVDSLSADPQEATEQDMWYERATPMEVNRSLMGDVVITQVAACANASFALTEGGDVFGWGTFRNNQGIMGLIPPTPPESATPKPKPKPTLHLSRKPANATNDTSTTLDTPLPTYIPTPIPSLQNTKITTLATSPTAQHILALSTITNTLYALGAGEQNQLGRRLTERNKLHGLDASKVEFPKSKSKSKEKGKGRVEITAICTADESSYALDSQGRIWTWGARFGAVSEGKDTALPQLHPAFVDLEVDGDVGPMVEIAASREVLFARTGGGCVVSAGRLDGLGSGHDISALPREDVAAVGGWRIGGMGSGVPASEGPAVLLKAQKIVFPRSEDAEEDDVHIISISASSCSASAVSKGGHCFVWGSGSGWRNGLGLSGRGGHRLGPGVLASEKLNSLEACADVEVPRDVWMGGLNVDVVRQVVLGGGSGGAAGGFGVYCAIADPGAQLVREQQGGECRREKKKALAGKEVGRDAGKFDMDDLGAAQKRRSLVAGVAGGEMLG